MPEVQSGQVAELLQRWVQGDEKALGVLAPLVYQELQRLAHYHLKSEPADHTLQSTALVNEASLRLIGGDPVRLENRGHFIAIASRAMREILVDYARSRGARKREAGVRIVLDDLDELPVIEDTGLIALEELSSMDARQGKVVEMKFFGGLSAPEISEVLGVSLATVERDWRTARIFLRRQMTRLASP
jgi:RNA polymerase sigma factor (TIGR02999 family)